MEFSFYGGRRGRRIIPNLVVLTAPSAVRNARERSLAVKGAKLFSMLPSSLRVLVPENWIEVSVLVELRTVRIMTQGDSNL